MAKKIVKKVDSKKVMKTEVMAIIEKALADAGYVVKAGEDFGMTSGTIVIKGDKCDVQLKPITPKAGVDHYEELEEEEEVEA